MITECPHCFTNVLPKTDGTCPACLAVIADTSGADLSLTRVTVVSGAQLPHICVSCGQATDKVISFTRKGPNANYVAGFPGGGVIGVIVGPLLDWISGKSRREISIRVPQCQTCSSAKSTIRVRHLDFESESATLIVRKEFKAALIKM